MRTTVTIDDDLLARAKEVAARDRRTLSDIVQDSLRTMLNNSRSDEGATSPLALPTFGGPGDQPLVDILDKEALAEAMGDNEPPRHAF